MYNCSLGYSHLRRMASLTKSQRNKLPQIWWQPNRWHAVWNAFFYTHQVLLEYISLFLYCILWYNYITLKKNAHFLKSVFYSILRVFYTFWTPYVHHQADDLYMQFCMVCFSYTIARKKIAQKNCTYKLSSWWWKNDVQNMKKTWKSDVRLTVHRNSVWIKKTN